MIIYFEHLSKLINDICDRFADILNINIPSWVLSTLVDVQVQSAYIDIRWEETFISIYGNVDI